MSAVRRITSPFLQMETKWQNKNFLFTSISINNIAEMKILKNCLINPFVKTGSKMSCHLKSESSGAFNFMGTFALAMCTNSHNLIIK